MTKTNFGNSLLPSHDAKTYEILEGKYGKFQVKPCAEFEEHAVFYLPDDGTMFVDDDVKPRGWTMLAMHSNGFSCKALAERIIQVWNGEKPPYYAINQYQYILDCGGLCRDEFIIEAVIDGTY